MIRPSEVPIEFEVAGDAELSPAAIEALAALLLSLAEAEAQPE